MNRVRIPRLYDDDPRSRIFGDAFRHPYAFGLPCYQPRATVSQVIEDLTGYRVVSDRGYHEWTRADVWWSAAALRKGSFGATDGVRAAFSNGYGRYYYVRDIIAHHLPRWRCSECGKKVRYHKRWQHEEKYEFGMAMWVSGLRHGRWNPCGPQCERFTASSQYARMHLKEQRKFREHCRALVCSPQCHNTVSLRYQRITLDLKETRVWLKEARELLDAVQERLPGRRHSPSRRAASSRRGTSATS